MVHGYACTYLNFLSFRWVVNLFKSMCRSEATVVRKINFGWLFLGNSLILVNFSSIWCDLYDEWPEVETKTTKIIGLGEVCLIFSEMPAELKSFYLWNQGQTLFLFPTVIWHFLLQFLLYFFGKSLNITVQIQLRSVVL